MDSERIYRRYRELQEYVGWTDDDALRVARAGKLLRPHLAALIDDFYAEIKRHPEANQVFADEEQVLRLKLSLRSWLEQLFSGPYDADYAIHRWQVGRRHVDVGLDHIYAHAALARLRRGLARTLRSQWPGEAADFDETLNSLNTLIDLDLAKIEDAYAAEYLDRLQKSERLAAIGQIAAGVAHEIRNPLNVVKTSVYFLLNAKSPSPERVAEHLARISRQVNHANDVITALSSFARPPAPQLSPVSVTECIKSALERYAPPAGIQVVSNLPASLPKVRADATQLAIVFGNLIRNAFDAMPAGGTLTLSGTQNGEQLEIQIADTGVGIAPDDLPKITEPLFSTKARGMGLGLAIISAILGKISGRLQVTSEIGRGSTFQVQIPVAENSGGAEPKR
jgi:two-component system, NtrC family, sensor kinase